MQPQILEEVRTLLRQQALKLPDEEQMHSLGKGDLNAVLKRIDPWAEWVESADVVKAEAVGIGAELYTGSGGFWLMPYVGGALFRAGIMDRVELRAVNGVSVAAMTITDVAQSLTGVEGEPVELSLCAVECQSPQRLSVQLETLSNSSVEQLEIAGRRILRLRHFAARETRVFLQTLLETAPSDAPLILDLRDCQGGDLFEAMDSAALFIAPAQELASTYRRAGLQRRYVSPPGEKFTNPLTLLISGNTASAGELFAGILKAHNRALLVGTTTLGKCVSQTESALSDGSLLRFTNLEVVLPDDRRCQAKGLIPDIEVTEQQVNSSRLLLEQLRQHARE